MKRVSQSSRVGYFCKETLEYEAESCGHELCAADPHVRVSDGTLVAFATTCSNREIALGAEVALRKRYAVRGSHRHIMKGLKGKA